MSHKKKDWSITNNGSKQETRTRGENKKIPAAASSLEV
jgi:hypothetical protein